MHVDDFIDGREYRGEQSDDAELYARWVLNSFRLPATLQFAFKQFIPKLFCTWQEKRWRVTGASRLGDIWLTEDFAKETGYDKRVDVAECSKWSAWPEPRDVVVCVLPKDCVASVIAK